MGRFDFNASEIFEMAEQIERNGAAFYKKAAAFIQGPAQKTLEELASWELKHEELFKGMKDALTSADKLEQVFDPDEEGARYLRAFADRHVFDTRQEAADRLLGDENLEQVLRMAIDLEKDSIVFYLGLRDATPNKAGRDKVEDIIKEEMRHVSILSDELRKALTS